MERLLDDAGEPPDRPVEPLGAFVDQRQQAIQRRSTLFDMGLDVVVRGFQVLRGTH